MPRRPTAALLFALAAVYVFWGATAPAMRVAVATLPPFAMAAIRFTVGGALIWTWVRMRGVPLPSAREWRAAAVTGIILLVASNAVFAWCLQWIPSGIGSLFFSLAPLWMAIFAALMFGERLTLLAAFGLALGIGGMAYLIAPHGTTHLALIPAVVAVLVSVAWAFGSMLQRRFAFVDLLQASAMQMLVAAVVLGAIAVMTGERLSAAEFTPAASGALLFLIVCGSVIGYSSYLYVMRNAPTVLAATYAYVNPVVALAIASLFLREPLTARTLIGAAVIVAGVALMIAAPKPSARTTKQVAAAVT